MDFFKRILKNKIYSLFIIFAVFFCSCNEYKLKKFIDRNFDEDFIEFKGKSLYFRGLDDKRNLLYFFNDIYASCSPIIVTVDKKTMKVIDIDSEMREADNTCNIKFDNTIITNLTEKIISYKISLIRVDYSNNVYIGINELEFPNLIKKNGYIEPKKMIKYKNYIDNWYISSR